MNTDHMNRLRKQVEQQGEYVEPRPDSVRQLVADVITKELEREAAAKQNGRPFQFNPGFNEAYELQRRFVAHSIT